MRFNEPRQNLTSAPGGGPFFHSQTTTHMAGEECLRPIHSRENNTSIQPAPGNNFASSAKSVGGFRFRQSSKCVIESHFHRFEGAKPIRASGYHSNLIVESFDCSA